MSVFQTVGEILNRLCDQGKLSPCDFELAENHSLSKLTSFHTGGDATVFFPETVSAVKELFPLLVREKIPYFVLGNGSNVIAKDEGYEGLILSLGRLKKTQVSENLITAECGVSITALATIAKKHSLSGMEFFYGIPGSVGGAVFMNAGAYGGECKDILQSVTFITPEGEVKELPAEELEMGYRTSIFEKNRSVILSATFRLKKGNEAEISVLMEDLMERRISKQPLEYPSAGSTFKRYEDRFTAKMIDDAGLKGARVGGAMVSEKHAGFVINYDHATSADIFRLIRRVKDVIFEKEGIHIQCEVRTIE